MVRLADLHKAGREGALALDCPIFDDQPFVRTHSSKDRTVAIVSTAGLITRGDKPFRGGDASYREFPQQVANDDILVSHISVNFDRLAALDNIESIFPRMTLTEMAASGDIKAVAKTHYSFMGATDPAKMEPAANTLAKKLIDEGVDTVVLLPV
jgi:D-proline reductase (dithiol) PrdB